MICFLFFFLLLLLLVFIPTCIAFYLFIFSLSGLAISPLQANVWGVGTIQCQVVLLVWIMIGQGHTVPAVGAGGGSSDIFFCRLSFFFSSSLCLGWMDG